MAFWAALASTQVNQKLLPHFSTSSEPMNELLKDHHMPMGLLIITSGHGLMPVDLWYVNKNPLHYHCIGLVVLPS